jgi:hypothetical protein
MLFSVSFSVVDRIKSTVVSLGMRQTDWQCSLGAIRSMGKGFAHWLQRLLGISRNSVSPHEQVMFWYPFRETFPNCVPVGSG